jgi:hypothetical protein
LTKVIVKVGGEARDELGLVLDDGAEARLARRQRRLGADALRDVALDRDEA